MKVLVVSHGFPPRGFWGTEIYTHELVHALVARGHEVSVLHPVREGDRERYSVEEVMEDGVRVLLLENPGDRSKRFEPSYRDAEVERRFAELLERERPDRVHFCYLLWGLSVRLPVVARELGIPQLTPVNRSIFGVDEVDPPYEGSATARIPFATPTGLITLDRIRTTVMK